MTETFSKQILRVVVAQLCQVIGWHSIATSALELMTDVLHRYLESMGRQIHGYSEQFGRTMPNVIDVGLTFLDMGVSITEMEEYIKNVESLPCVYEVPKYPIPRDSHLNFLKPGSREVVTRPVHVHEHLPPMHPEMEEEEYVGKQTPLSIDTTAAPGTSSPLTSPKANVFKRPGDPVSLESPALKRARLILEEEGRPLREISSVMMTTSGFLSPAREGKLPESRTPLQPSDSRSNSPQPSSYPMVPPEVKGEKKTKKIPFKKVAAEGIKKVDKENKKKELKNKELCKFEKVAQNDDSKVKKLVSMKELSKLKALKSGALKMMSHTSLPGPSMCNKSPKMNANKISPNKSPIVNSTKNARSPSQMKVPKVEKPLPVTPPPPPPKASPPPEKIKDMSVVDGKLSTEPDKQKLNIFKKISKVKDEKSEKLEKVERTEPFEPPPKDSRESSPGLVIDESELNNRQREARMAQIDDCIDAVIQRSMEIVEEPSSVKEAKTPVDTSATSELPSVKVDNSANEVAATPQPDSDQDVYMFDDDLFPPGTPSTPNTPEPVTLSSKSDKPTEQKEKKRKRDKSKSKKDIKGKSPKSVKKTKSDTKVESPPERPKTPIPECPPPPVFPFFPHFCPAPGLIPPPIPSVYSLFQRFPPVHVGKNLPHPAMPNLPLPPPHFMQQQHPIQRSEDTVTETSSKLVEKPPPPPLLSASSTSNLKVEKEREKERERERLDKMSSFMATPKEKLPEKKLHKKERKEKDKTKKKKDRKEKGKGKEKGEKKKIKVEKKERVKEKLKDKKEKKEKKKDKEREEKVEAGVPKITLKLGPASPRPPTPDAQMRKFVIKPMTKKQNTVGEETIDKGHALPGSERQFKREPSPELARISALIRGPPKPKSSSKTALPKQDVHLPDVSPVFSQSSMPPASSASVVSAPTTTSVPNPPPNLSSSLDKSTTSKVKKPLNAVSKFKPKHTMKKDPEPEPEPEPQEQVAYYYDSLGNKVWICPSCGGQDDGSPMIGCDDCDAWYHWVCVGIQVPPDENEDWYCRVCIVKKKQENVVDKKKKPRKRKMTT